MHRMNTSCALGEVPTGGGTPTRAERPVLSDFLRRLLLACGLASVRGGAGELALRGMRVPMVVLRSGREDLGLNRSVLHGARANGVWTAGGRAIRNGRLDIWQEA